MDVLLGVAASVPSETWRGVLFSGVIGAVIGGAVTAGAVWATLRSERRAREADRISEIVGQCVALTAQLNWAATMHDDTRESMLNLGALWSDLVNRTVRLQILTASLDMPTASGLFGYLTKKFGAAGPQMVTADGRDHAMQVAAEIAGIGSALEGQPRKTERRWAKLFKDESPGVAVDVLMGASDGEASEAVAEEG